VAFIKSDFLKNAGVLFSSTGIAQLIAFLLIPLLAYIYPPEVHGVAALFTSIVSVCVAFSGFQYEQAIIVEGNREKAKHLMYLSILLTLAWALLFYLILLLFQPSISTFFNLKGSSSWMYLVPITIVFTSVTEIFVSWYNRDRSYKKLAVNRVMGMVSGSAYKVVHPFAKLVSGNGLILGHIVGQALQMILLAPFRKLSQFRMNVSALREVAKEYRDFPKLATPSALVNIIGTYMPVFLITAMISEEMTGFYSNAIKLTFIPLSAISYAVGQVFFERLARLRNNEEERKKLSSDLLKFLFFLSVIPVTVLMIWGDELVTLILGSDWSTSGSIAQITVVFYFAMYLTGPFSAAFEVFNALHRQLWYTASFAVLTTLALFITLKVTGNIYFALMAHAFVGIIIRLLMLVDCFKLIGLSSLMRILKGFLILGGLTLLLAAIKFATM